MPSRSLWTAGLWAVDSGLWTVRLWTFDLDSGLPRPTHPLTVSAATSGLSEMMPSTPQSRSLRMSCWLVDGPDLDGDACLVRELDEPR